MSSWASIPAGAEYRRTCGAYPAVPVAAAEPAADGAADAADRDPADGDPADGAACGAPAGLQPATSAAASSAADRGRPALDGRAPAGAVCTTGARARRYRMARRDGDLPERRRLFDIWERYVLAGRAAQPSAGSRPEIATSWARSVEHIAPDVPEAPLADPAETRATWDASPLRTAVARIESELRSAAEDGGLVVAVTDPAARILWTCEGSVMRRYTAGVNFVPGGRWDEASVGTNALDLALRLDRAAAVHSAEHFNACVHDWTCWAAPVHDPVTGRQLGVLDLSTTWDRVHPMGGVTVAAFARLLEQALPATGTGPPGRLELRLLGRAQALLDGVPLRLTRRQLEILALLVLYPDGLSLDALHAHLYGDRSVSRTTLKAEVSHLRTIVHGAVASRPYRLVVPVSCDATEVLESLRGGRLLDAATAYRGELLAGTDAPGLTEHSNYLAVAIREALLARPDPQAVLRYAEAVPHDVAVLERALRALGNAPHPARPLLRARLRTAD
jgi:hypothetical protein